MLVSRQERAPSFCEPVEFCYIFLDPFQKAPVEFAECVVQQSITIVTVKREGESERSSYVYVLKHVLHIMLREASTIRLGLGGHNRFLEAMESHTSLMDSKEYSILLGTYRAMP